MGAYRQSALSFLHGVGSRSYFWLFALILDPFDLYSRFKPNSWPSYNVNLDVFFWVLGGIVLWTAFLTYHELWSRSRRDYFEPDMPLHRALRWVARDSVWAAAYRGDDREWVEAVKLEFLSRWHLGRFEMVGVDSAGTGGSNYLPPAMKGSSDFNAHYMEGEEPPTHIWNAEYRTKDGRLRCFYNVCVDSRDIKATWPRRHLFARIARRSPIERLNKYDQIFVLQDRWYVDRRTLPTTPLEWILETDHG